MNKKKSFIEKKIFNWFFKNSSKKNNEKLTAEQVNKKARMNGGWDREQLFIPILTTREFMLRYASVWKAIAYFCIPTVILMLTQGLYNILDKTLALQFATPHASANWDYFHKLIIGANDHSILMDALNSTSDRWTSFLNFFSLDSTANLNNLKIAVNNAEQKTILMEVEKLYNLNQITISAERIREYINVTTQYTMQTYNLAYSFSQIMAIGAGMHYAVQFGRGKKEQLGEITGNSISQSFLVSIAVAMLLFFLSFPSFNQVLISSQMGGHKNEVITALAWSDVEPLIYGLPTMFVAGVIMNMVRSEGKMWHIMIMTLTSLIVKCGVSISAMHFGGMELTGAQLGTIMAFLYQILYCLVVIYASKISYSKFKIRNLFILQKQNWTETIKAGIPNFIIYFAVVVNSYVSTAVVIKLPIPKEGPSFEQNGGVSILQQLISSMTPWAEFILSACIGLNQGVRTMIAYNYGAKRNARIVSILRRSTWLMFGWFLFILLLIVSAGPVMMTMFAFPKEYANYGSIFYFYQFLYFFTYPFASLTYIALGLFQGTSKSRAATLCTSLRSMVIFLPMLGIGYSITIATNNSLWFFLFVGLSDFVSGLIIAPMLIIFYLRVKRANKLINIEESLINQAIYNKTLFAKTNEKKYLEKTESLIKQIKKKHKKMQNKPKL
ncbi:hypothetical protein ESOMN_v1c00440 [Williamsoniiplasma somnilux]|uniref:MATE efflux family protein n=1 Tax=Williamsoniiplasma somnilux TaxID=215578 RepID=A0A2K8NX75_9MOLU|nr:MATE family efflux transporter [Williamsoniiplasma somnilux]ATZ18430.1 hypothetical protein ESOMN_v1c00440 [Williamsoniiplasma somnilux]